MDRKIQDHLESTGNTRAIGIFSSDTVQKNKKKGNTQPPNGTHTMINMMATLFASHHFLPLVIGKVCPSRLASFASTPAITYTPRFAFDVFAAWKACSVVG